MVKDVFLKAFYFIAKPIGNAFRLYLLSILSKGSITPDKIDNEKRHFDVGLYGLRYHLLPIKERIVFNILCSWFGYVPYETVLNATFCDPPEKIEQLFKTYQKEHDLLLKERQQVA